MMAGYRWGKHSSQPLKLDDSSFRYYRPLTSFVRGAKGAKIIILSFAAETPANENSQPLRGIDFDLYTMITF